MRKKLFCAVSILCLIWLLWGTGIVCCEWIKRGIPEKIHLYEEDAVGVLSGADQKLDPEQLCLDFAGNIEISQTAEGQYEAMCSLFGLIPLKTMEIEVVSAEYVYPGGIPIGIYVETDGVFVIGTGVIEAAQGEVESPAKNIVKTGDYIISFNGETIEGKQELVNKLADYQEDSLVLGVRRGEEELVLCIHPVILEDGAHLGIWVRDDTQGVGTLSYVTETGEFAALGHGISDEDSDLLMEVSKGKLYDCEIIDVTKGVAGNPGKILGKIVYRQSNLYGEVTGNLSGGIYGTANAHLLEKICGEALPTALKQEVQEGKAVIRSSVSGELEEYVIEITKIHRGEQDVNKGMEIKVKDDRLIALTGGIVQGMSGSPICQNGKIVGAVTHVLVNDPTRGYGIFIENMLDAAE